MSRKWLGLVLVLGVLVLLYAVASVLGRKPVQSGENDASDTRQRNKIERTDNAHFGDGTFIIGEDIQPGTYRASSPSRGCYYARLSGFGGSVDDILANANTDYPTVVTIQPTDKGFKSDGCGTWTAVSSSVATPASIPFVGCPSDGQVGPLKAPSGNGPNISAPPELAKQLAYYKSKTSPLVLGPRGWSCFGVYGSNGDVLYISPSPISGSNALANDGSGGFTGAAIEVAVRFGGTSGRYDVAKLINRVFPSHKDFATRVIGDGFAPASDFPSGPYPQDKLTYKSNEVVEFATPAHTDGLGTDSFLRQNDSPISGVVILVEKAGEAPDSWYLALRLPLEFENLSQIIIQQLERAANVGGTVQQEPPAPVRHGTPHVENYQTPSPPANAPSATPNTQNLPSERPADAPRLALPPQPSTPASLPAPPAEVAKPTSGVLCNWPVEIPQNGEVKFRNLPSDRLKFTFDHDAWLPRIHREPDGTQTLIMRSIKPDVQTKCDIRWEIVQ
jgi:hypothetical protein